MKKIAVFSLLSINNHGEQFIADCIKYLVQQESDVDIAVYGCEDFARFSLDVEDEVWTLLKFDVVNMDGDVSEELKNEIHRDGVVIYEKV